MATIHVIYDPEDRLSPPPPEQAKRLGLSIAMLALSGPLDPDQRRAFVSELADMILKEEAQ